jgi:hypothetical protein
VHPRVGLDEVENGQFVTLLEFESRLSFVHPAAIAILIGSIYIYMYIYIDLYFWAIFPSSVISQLRKLKKSFTSPEIKV